MMFEAKTLELISEKSKGKPFESEDHEDEDYHQEAVNLWGAHEMFTKLEKKRIAEEELANDETDVNQRALRQLIASNAAIDEAAAHVIKEGINRTKSMRNR